MKFAGEDGVAAYGVLMYVNFVFLAIFIGIGIGSACEQKHKGTDAKCPASHFQKPVIIADKYL